MNRLIAITVSALSVTLFAADAARADHRGTCCCPCAPVVQAPCAPAQATPPAAPMEGTTQQSQSVEPQAGPPAAPQAGVTTRSYSYQPAPAYRPAAPQGRSTFDPEQRRLRPSNRFVW